MKANSNWEDERISVVLDSGTGEKAKKTRGKKVNCRSVKLYCKSRVRSECSSISCFKQHAENCSLANFECGANGLGAP